MQFNLKLFIFFVLLTTACGKKAETGNFDKETWKADRYACQDKRQALLPELENVRHELVGMTGADALKIFGKPEATSLADQAERVYFYYLTPGPQCQEPNTLAAGNKLMVRINGIGLVSEIGYEQPLGK